MSSLNRRRFVQAAAALGATRSVLGANDRVNLTIIGVGGRGRDHIADFSKVSSCNISGVCDVNQAAQEQAVMLVERATGRKPKVYSDMREVFADKEVDAVSMATPNHWHALATIWACQAGKDVYVEKPACHNIFEGRQMIEAARKYKRMVQVGSQSRTTAHKIRAMQLLGEGVIGKLYLAKGLCYKRRRSIGRTPDEPVPPGVDWDKFLGPAQMKPYSRNKFAYNWHWFWDTGNGDIGNQGVHEMDICRWGMGEAGMPKTVTCSGGKYIYDDDQETPNTQLATFDYGDRQIVFEVRGLLTGEEGGIPLRGGNVIGNLFYGTDGYMALDVAGFQVYKGEKHEKVMDEKVAENRMWDTTPHMDAFVQAVKERDVKRLTAPVEVGVMSANFCHLANIAYRTGRKLTVDAASWSFVGDAEANRLLTRNYRAPYVVPDKV